MKHWTIRVAAFLVLLGGASTVLAEEMTKQELLQLKERMTNAWEAQAENGDNLPTKPASDRFIATAVLGMFLQENGENDSELRQELKAIQDKRTAEYQATLCATANDQNRNSADATEQILALESNVFSVDDLVMAKQRSSVGGSQRLEELESLMRSNLHAADSSKREAYYRSVPDEMVELVKLMCAQSTDEPSALDGTKGVTK